MSEPNPDLSAPVVQNTWDYLQALFVRQEFAASFSERDFFTWRNLAEILIAAAVMWLTAQLASYLAGRRKSDVQHGWRYIAQRMAWPVLLMAAAILAALVWYEWSGHRSVWLRLLVIAAPWMMLIRIFVALLRYILPDKYFSISAERSLAALLWAGFLLWVSGLDRFIRSWMHQIALPVGKESVSLYAIVTGAFWVLVIMLLAMWISQFLENRLMKLQRMDLNLRIVLGKILRTAAVFLAFLIALPMVGIDLTVLSVFGGALGVGLGFGLQKIASNYVSGFIILLDRSIRLNDRLVIGGFTGYVTRLTSRYVVLRDSNGVEAIVPNETFISNTVMNESFSSRSLYRSLSVQVAYNTDLPRAMEIMVQAAAKNPRVSQASPPNAFLTNFADNGIDLSLGFWVNDPENGFALLTSNILMTIWQEFNAAGIEFPYPQREVRILNPAPNPPAPDGHV